MGESEPFIWVRRSGVEPEEVLPVAPSDPRYLARFQLVSPDGSIPEGYSPMESEPDLYLEFAALGRRVWQLRDLRQPESAADHQEEISLAVDFTNRFGHLKHGPLTNEPFVNQALYGHTGNVLPSVLDVITEARYVDLVLLGQRFATEGLVSLGETYFDRRTAGIREYADLAESLTGDYPNDGMAVLRKQAEDIEQETRSTDSQKIRVATDIAGLIDERLKSENAHSTITAGINFSVNRGSDPTMEMMWRRQYELANLRAAIWAQVANHVLSGSTWRECRNTACERGLFRIDRPKSSQRYCDDRCKDQQNNRDKYRKHPERYGRKA
jgi:hypothetical protein